MNENIKNILDIYEDILKSKKSLSEAILNAPIPITKVTSPYGEKRSYENHPGVDLRASSGTEIHSPADGKVIDVKQDSRRCGGTIFIDHKNGYKTRYCHVKDIKVNVGDEVKQGEIVGISGGNSGDRGAGNSKNAHLHFEVYKDGRLVNPMDHIDKNVVIFNDTDDKSTDNLDLDSYGLGSSDLDSSDLSTKNIGDKVVKGFIDKLIAPFGLKESKIYSDFGKGIKEIGGSYLLTKEKNDTIYSPVSGQINNVKINLNCKNQITVFHDFNGEEYHLEFCGISKPYVRNGDNVNQGTILGKTNDDVTVTLYDKRWKRVNLKSASKVELKSYDKEKNKKKDKDKDKEKKPITPYKSKTGYQDPTVDLLGSILTYPFRYKEKEKEDKSKISKFASPTSKNQPEPGFLLNMFKNKKVNENIERIKKLLK